MLTDLENKEEGDLICTKGCGSRCTVRYFPKIEMSMNNVKDEVDRYTQTQSRLTIKTTDGTRYAY